MQTLKQKEKQSLIKIMNTFSLLEIDQQQKLIKQLKNER